MIHRPLATIKNRMDTPNQTYDREECPSFLADAAPVAGLSSSEGRALITLLYWLRIVWRILWAVNEPSKSLGQIQKLHPGKPVFGSVRRILAEASAHHLGTGLGWFLKDVVLVRAGMALHFVVAIGIALSHGSCVKCAAVLQSHTFFERPIKPPFLTVASPFGSIGRSSAAIRVWGWRNAYTL